MSHLRHFVLQVGNKADRIKILVLVAYLCHVQIERRQKFTDTPKKMCIWLEGFLIYLSKQSIGLDLLGFKICKNIEYMILYQLLIFFSLR